MNKGDHGYHSGEMDMKTIFRAFGPDFRRNFLSEPFDSVHIYPLMCRVLQIQPAPHNGSLTVTEGMLLHSGESLSNHRRDNEVHSTSSCACDLLYFLSDIFKWDRKTGAHLLRFSLKVRFSTEGHLLYVMLYTTWGIRTDDFFKSCKRCKSFVKPQWPNLKYFML